MQRKTQKAIDKSEKECYTNNIIKIQKGEARQCSVSLLHSHFTTFIITQSNVIKVIFAVQNKIARDCFFYKTI